MPSRHKIRKAYAAHQTRQRCLRLCQECLGLISHLQQHRGTTLAILGGDTFFESRLTAIKPNIVAAMHRVQQLRAEFIDEHSWQALCSEWFTVNHHWRQDGALENFELHCHLIQHILRAFRHFVHAPYFAELEADDRELVEVALLSLPDLMETAAQMRGLGTHCLTASGDHSSFIERLSFLSRYFEQSLEQHARSRPGDPSGLTEHWKEVREARRRIQPVIRSLELRGGDHEPMMAADHFYAETSHMVYYIQLCTKLCLAHLLRRPDETLTSWIQCGASVPESTTENLQGRQI